MPPSPQNPSAADTAHALNARFRLGGPEAASDDIDTVGVLISQFDELSNPARPWLFVDSTQYAQYSDRRSAFLIFGSMPKAQGGWTTAGEIPLFGYVGGFVLRPEAFAERGGVLCGYPYDPHTFNYKCIPPGLSETCVPGCCCGGSKGAPAWVKGFIGATAYFQDAYKPGDLRSMLADYVNRAPGNARGYNEVIVNEARWHGQLPHSFDAMFFPATTKCAEDAACEQLGVGELSLVQLSLVQRANRCHEKLGYPAV